MDNYAELLVILAKSMSIEQIVMELAKYSSDLNNEIKSKRLNPTLECMKDSYQYQKTLTFC